MTKKYVRCLIYVTLICCLFAQLVQAQYHFGSLTYDKGLSNSTVLSICRDHAGFLWIGTRDGLNRYDGNRIKQNRSDNTDIHTISTNNYIYSIVEHPRQKHSGSERSRDSIFTRPNKTVFSGSTLSMSNLKIATISLGAKRK